LPSKRTFVRRSRPRIPGETKEQLRQRIVFRLAKRARDYEQDGDEWIADDLRFAVRRLLQLYPVLFLPKDMLMATREQRVCDVTATNYKVREFQVMMVDMTGLSIEQREAIQEAVGPHATMQVAVDLCPASVKRCKNFMKRGTTPVGTEVRAID